MIDLHTAFDVFADRMIRVVVFDVQRYLVAAGLFTLLRERQVAENT